MQTTHELKSDILGLDILKYNATRAAIELDLWKRGQNSVYQYTGSTYGFMKWKQAIGNDTNLLALAGESADKSNSIDRKELALLTNATSGTPDLEVIFSDGYVGTRGYPANVTTGYGKQYATLIGYHAPLRTRLRAHQRL